MKKIPTMFERDRDGDRGRVLDKIHPGCEWVAAGEGIATRKVDGTCCLVRDDKLYKRRELRLQDCIPPYFERVDFDEETGKSAGWVPVVDGPEDRRHREAFHPGMLDGTYELLGPKVQGNPEGMPEHVLVPHSATESFSNVPRTFDALREWFKGRDIEGLVFHHPDGRMAKIKKRDFGMKRRETRDIYRRINP